MGIVLTYKMHALLTTFLAGCSMPTAPTGGSVGHFESATEGSEITYHCPPGYLLSGPSTATCTSNLTWVPNSSEVNCTKTLLPGGTTMYTNENLTSNSVFPLVCRLSQGVRWTRSNNCHCCCGWGGCPVGSGCCDHHGAVCATQSP